jgi:hypothetical protein
LIGPLLGAPAPLGVLLVVGVPLGVAALVVELGVVAPLVAVLGVVAPVVELPAAAFAVVFVALDDEPPHAVRPKHASRTIGNATALLDVGRGLLRWGIELLCSRPT